LIINKAFERGLEFFIFKNHEEIRPPQLSLAASAVVVVVVVVVVIVAGVFRRGRSSLETAV
jgi:hypothetical protein